MEIKVRYTETVGQVTRTVDISIPVSSEGQTDIALGTNTFNASELIEAETIKRKLEADKHVVKAVEPALSPEEAFGSKPVTDAPSTVGAAPLATAPVATTEAISAANVTAPPVRTSVNVPAPVAPIVSRPVTGAETDTEGLPWDARIHAETRSKVSNGSWKLKRGVDKALVEAVKNELATIMAIPAGVAPAVVATPPPPPAPVVTAPPPPPVVTAPPPPPVNLFAQLLLQITALTSAGTITNEQVIQACQAQGLPALPTLAQRQDLVPAVAAALGIVL